MSEHTLQKSARRRVLGLGTLPVACTVMVGINALYILLVAFGNITDYGTNFDFVSHVLSMDTTNFGAPAGEGLDSDVMWRAIEADWVHHLAYVGVIIWESAAAIVLLCSLWAWLRASRTRSFDLARRESAAIVGASLTGVTRIGRVRETVVVASFAERESVCSTVLSSGAR